MKFVIFSSLVALLLNMPIPTAQAIFGLGQCEKVKKEIQTLEIIVPNLIDSLRGENYTPNGRGSMFHNPDEIFILSAASVKAISSIKKDDPIPRIWKVSFNNPKCFTNTQKLRIEKLKDEGLYFYVSTAIRKKYKQTTFCTQEWKIYPDGIDIAKYDKKCLIGTVTILNGYNSYTSLYDY